MRAIQQTSQFFLEKIKNRAVREIYFRYVRGTYMNFARRIEPSRWEKAGVPVLDARGATEVIAAAIRKGHPFAAARIGGIECRWLHWLLDGAPLTSASGELHTNVGLFPPHLAVYREFLQKYGESLTDLDLLGLWYGKRERRIHQAFHLHAAVCEMAPILLNVEELALGIDHSWIGSLAGKRVVVISSFAEVIAERANEAAWNQYWNGRVAWPQPASIEALYFPYGQEEATAAKYGDSLQLLNRLEEDWAPRIAAADVVLAGCGGYAIPLLAWAKRLGKTAIHLGSHVQLLFGLKGRRWDNRTGALGQLYNEHWIRPPRHLVPMHASKVEDGCYW